MDYTSVAYMDYTSVAFIAQIDILSSVIVNNFEIISW